jgi:hypothetical protein
MANEVSSLKKAAVLTGLTMVIGGAEVSTADAATTTPQTNTFSITAFPFNTATVSPSFNQFNPSLGTLTSVDFSLDSNISANASITGFSATITVDNGVQLSSKTPTTLGDYDVTFTGLVGAANLAFYTGTASFPVVLTLTNNTEQTVTWNGQSSGQTGLTLTYDYTPAVPLPATLPLFATGLAGLGFTTWLGRRKQKTKAES